VSGSRPPRRERVLVTGAGGQLGVDLTSVLDAHGAFEAIAATHSELDCADRSQVREALVELEPAVVVHAGAWTDVDGCEVEPERAWRANALATRWVAEWSRVVGAHLVYVSTDYVFDGTKGSAYHEWDEPNPTSVYGRSKLAGEREAGPGATVVRTSWVSGAHGRNIVRRALELLGEGRTLRFVDDQVGCPTFTSDLARGIVRLIEGRFAGTWHLTNSGAVSWFGFVREVARQAGFDPEAVQPISTADLDPPRRAPRPACSALDNLAIRLAGLPELRAWQEALSDLLVALGAK
jgi:dTDP-4-dehydrorhamnose reductase